MKSTTLFVDGEKKTLILDWYERFRTRIPVPVEDATVETSFGRTHALIAGPRDAPALVLTHGALASSAHVLPELGPLLQSRRVYALDVIGQSGWSEDRRMEVSGDDYGRWLHATATGLGLGTFDLFGVSYGGFVALRAAVTAPERVRHLILMVPAGIVNNSLWASLRDAGFAMLRHRFLPSSRSLERVLQSQFTTLDKDWSPYFADALRCYRLDIRLPPLATDDELTRIRCPLLVFAAERDASFPGAMLQARVKQILPEAQVELIRDSKHCPPLTPEFRAWMAGCVERFLMSPVVSIEGRSR